MNDDVIDTAEQKWYAGRGKEQLITRDHRIIWDRLRRQGQYDEGQLFYRQHFDKEYTNLLRRDWHPTSAKKYAKMLAMNRVDKAFPHDQKLQDKMRRQEYREARMPEESEKQEQLARDMEHLKWLEDELGKLDATTTLIEDMQWARANEHRLKDPDNPDTWLIHPKEAPSASAFNTLLRSKRDPTEFGRQMIRVVTAHETKERDHQRELELKRMAAPTEDDVTREEKKSNTRKIIEGVLEQEAKKIRAQARADG